jgi:hypothetical protein
MKEWVSLHKSKEHSFNGLYFNKKLLKHGLHNQKMFNFFFSKICTGKVSQDCFINILLIFLKMVGWSREHWSCVRLKAISTGNCTLCTVPFLYLRWSQHSPTPWNLRGREMKLYGIKYISIINNNLKLYFLVRTELLDNLLMLIYFICYIIIPGWSRAAPDLCLSTPVQVQKVKASSYFKINKANALL